MTAFTKTTPGHPTQGFYTLGDTITDSNNIVWTAIRTGFAGGQSVAGLAVGALFVPAPLAQVSATNGGTVTASVTGLSAVEKGSADGIRKTTFTLAAMPITIVDANVAGAQKIYTFPEGRILLLGATSSLAPTTTTAIATTLNSGVTFAHALGSVTAAADGSLTSTEADMLPSANFTSSTTINVAAAAVTNKLAASAQFDGTSTAIAAFLNLAVPTATDIDADAIVTLTGTITLNWVFLGDY